MEELKKDIPLDNGNFICNVVALMKVLVCQYSLIFKHIKRV